VNINAYHQPGVEAGKKAATRVLELQKQVEESLGGEPGKTAEEIAQALQTDPEDVFHILRHLAANDPAIQVAGGDTIGSQRYFRED
jgi:glucose-6-phosphate isomerase